MTPTGLSQLFAAPETYDRVAFAKAGTAYVGVDRCVVHCRSTLGLSQGSESRSVQKHLRPAATKEQCYGSHMHHQKQSELMLIPKQQHYRCISRHARRAIRISHVGLYYITDIIYTPNGK